MLKTIGNQFRQRSGILGKLVSLVMKKRNISTYNRLIADLEIKKNGSLFEIGYSLGLGISWILKNNDCFISGIDFSELMYNESKKCNKKHIDAGKVQLNFGDFLDFKLKENTYDKIFCINVVYFWKDLEIPFSKIRNGLKENGTFCFYMAHRNDLEKLKFTKDGIFNKYTIEVIIEKLKISGFERIDYQFDK